MKENLESKKIEHINISHKNYLRGVKSAETIKALAKTAMEFSRIERKPRYADGELENNAEHSFMLSLVAPEIAVLLDLGLDVNLIARYGTVHDLLELETGDIPTFDISKAGLEAKKAAEHRALPILVKKLPPDTGRVLVEYESQQNPEARFVRYIDKLLPIAVDIIGAGEQVMKDYGITNQSQLREHLATLQERFELMFNGEFEDIDRAHKLLCEYLEVHLYS